MGVARQEYIPALRYDVLTPFFDPFATALLRIAPFQRRLVELAGIQAGHRVLDLGCGAATLAIMVKRMRPSAEVTGLDGDLKILEIARSKVAKLGLDIRLDEGMAFALPYPNESLDRVVSSMVMHHLTSENKLRTCREVVRVLRRGGELHVADFGIPQTAGMRLLSRIGMRFEETEDLVAGLLPDIFRMAGLKDVRVAARYKTPFGSVSLYHARKPET